MATPHLSKTAKAALVIVGLLLAMSVGYASFEIREFPSALFGGQ